MAYWLAVNIGAAAMAAALVGFIDWGYRAVLAALAAAGRDM